MKAEQLRKSILQLAIQGKLVPQDPNDEPASVLLDRIRAEKQKLIKEGKIKKDKTDSIIFKGDDNCYYEQIGKEVRNITDEIPFEIPESWCWTRIKSAFDIRNGFTPLRTESRYWNDGTIPWFTIEDIRKNGNIIYNTEQKINKCAVTEERIAPENSFLICCTASVGVYAQTKIPLTTNQQFNALSVKQMYKKLVNDNWLFTIGAYFSDILHSLAGKTTFEFISVKKLSDILIPIPSINEQTRISKEIRKYEPLIVEYDKLEQQSTKLDSEIKDKLKKSILQYAVQGKLVEQDTNDEPASVLLEKIRAEKKAQLGKKYVDSYIYKGDDNCYYEKIGNIESNITDNLPFNIPKNWYWIRVGALFQHNTGKALNSSNTSGKKMQYITTSNLYWNRFELDKLKEMPFTDNEVEKCTIQKGDLLVCEGGDVGRAAIWSYDFSMRIQNHIHRLRSYIDVNTKFYYYLFYFYKQAGLIGGKGIGIQGLSSNAIDKLLFPLPPINEQNRIVYQVEIIFSKLKDKD